MQGQKPSGQKIVVAVKEGPERSIDLRWNPHPAADGSAHFEAKCPACGCTAYVHGEDGKPMEAAEVRKHLEARESFTRRCGVCKVRINL